MGGRKRGTSSAAMVQRNSAIVRRYLALCEAGDRRAMTTTAEEFGLSRQRVHQIVTDPDRLRLAGSAG